MNQALKQTPSLRDRIVEVLREHHEVKHIGALADKLEAALAAQAQDVAGWQPIETAPTAERLIIIGSYNAKKQWCAEVWSSDYLRQEQAKSASGFYESAPHLEWIPTHWMPLAAPLEPAR